MNSDEIIKNYENKINALTADLTTYQKRCEQYALAYDQLQHQLKELLRNRFGKKSERFIDPEHPQLSFLQDNAHLFTEEEAKGDAIGNEIQVASHTRKKKKSEKELPRRIEIIPATEEQKRCSCGCQKKVIPY